MPAGYRADQPAPFVLSLHGAGGDATSGLYPLRDLADEAGLILLSPASRQSTWDVIRGGYGPDVAFIDRALAAAFARCAVDPELLAVAGFSDGASYAVVAWHHQRRPLWAGDGVFPRIHGSGGSAW